MHAPRETLPRFIEPMLLGSGLPPRLDDGWALEVKWDGLRAQLCVGGAGWTLRSRPGRDCTADFAELADLASMLQPHCVVLDGELVHLAADGKPEFAAISRRLVGKRAGRRPAAATFVAFDVLHLNGRAVRALPYAARREILEDLLQDGPLWRVPRSLCGPAEAVLAVTRDAQLEGVVAKRLSAPYEPARRSGAWRKHKHRRNEWFALTGWSPAEGTARSRPALHVARVTADGELVAAGAVQLGLHSKAARPLRELLEARPARRPKASRVLVPPGIAVEVAFHGPPGGPLRDAILREVRIGPVRGDSAAGPEGGRG